MTHDTALKRSRGRFLTFLVGYGVLFNLLIASVAGLYLQRSYQVYQQRAQTSTSNIASLLSEYIDGVVRTSQDALVWVKDEFERELEDGKINTPRAASFLNRVYALYPYFESIRYANARGDVLLGIRVTPGKVNISDRQYFKQLRENPRSGFLIASPLLSRMTGAWVLNFAMRVEDSDGSFAGVVAVQMTLNSFVELFRKVDVGPRGVISLRNEAFELIARNQDLPGENKGIAETNISEKLKSAIKSSPVSGVLDNKGIDGIQRFVAFRKVAAYPLYVIVGLAIPEYLAPWWAEARTLGMVLLSILLGTVLAGRIIYGRWERETSAIRKLHESREELEIRVKERTANLDDANRKLEAELAERKVLLRELYHRTKNNMNVISNLLSLQALQLDSAAARTALEEMQSRIRSMALVHEKLYRSRNLTHVNLSEYIDDLMGSLLAGFRNSTQQIDAVLDVAPIFLSIEAAIPLALVINELVTNSLKHGLKPGQSGKILLKIRAAPENGIFVTYSDTGAPFPPGFMLEAQKGLGTQLIRTLVLAQLKGTLELEPGIKEFRIAFRTAEE